MLHIRLTFCLLGFPVRQLFKGSPPVKLVFFKQLIPKKTGVNPAFLSTLLARASDFAFIYFTNLFIPLVDLLSCCRLQNHLHSLPTVCERSSRPFLTFEKGVALTNSWFFFRFSSICSALLKMVLTASYISCIACKNHLYFN